MAADSGDHYGEIFADFYDDWYGDRDDVNAVVSCVEQLAAGGRVLELGIGTGRLAVPLAAAGIPVTGIDSSTAMLDRLRAKRGGESIDIVLGDMCDTKVGGPFSLVLLAFSTLFLLDSQDAQLRCVQNAARHLAPGGRLVVEAFIADIGRYTRDQLVEVRDVRPDRVTLHVARHDRAAQRIETQTVLWSADRVQLVPSTLRYVWPSELDLMAQMAGFRLEHRWSGWSGEPFSATSGEHVSVYTRERDAASPRT